MGFREQLQLFERMNHKIDNAHPEYMLYWDAKNKSMKERKKEREKEVKGKAKARKERERRIKAENSRFSCFN